jgi:hypothetical protein
MACEAAPTSHPHKRFGPARETLNRGTLNGGFSTGTAVSGVLHLVSCTVLIVEYHAKVRYENKRS